MATKTELTGKKLDKDNLIFEVLGCLDQCSAEIGSASLKADDKTSQILNQIQKDLADFSSIVAECEKNNINQRLDWLKNQVNQIESQVDIPQKFILPGKSELEVRLNLARVAVRKAERRAVSLNRYQKLPEEFLDYLNCLSWFLFLIGLM